MSRKSVQSYTAGFAPEMSDMGWTAAGVATVVIVIVLLAMHQAGAPRPQQKDN